MEAGGAEAEEDDGEEPLAGGSVLGKMGAYAGRTYEEDVKADADAVCGGHGGGCMRGVEGLVMRNVREGRAERKESGAEGI